MSKPSNKQYWVRWTFACGIGEFLGIGIAAGLWFLHSAVFGEPDAVGWQVLFITFMVFAGVIEGLVVGAFQWSALRIRFDEIKTHRWLFFTVLGAATAWFLGMVPSTFFMSGVSGDSSTAGEPPIVVFLLLAALLGVVLGALFGVFQWIELKRHVRSASRWILANACGWLAGMVVIFMGASLPLAEATIAVIILVGAVSGLLGGLLVGGVTGLFLVKLEKTSIIRQ